MKVSIWCDDLIGYVTAKVIIKRYLSKGVHVDFYTRDNLVNFAKKSINDLNLKVISIQDIDNKFINLLHHFFRLFLTPDHYSWMYSSVVKPSLYGEYLSKVSRKINFKTRKSNFQKIYRQIFKIGCYDFKSRVIISISRVSRPYLFLGCNRHIAIVESWDHSMKEPWYFKPRVSMVWNKSMREKVIEYQDVIKIKKIEATKFAYLKNEKQMLLSVFDEEMINNNYLKDLDFINKNKYVLYSVAFADVNEEGINGEIKFIWELIAAARNLGYMLYIKPKPFGNLGKLLNEFGYVENVFIGTSPLYGGGYEILSDRYNYYRAELLRRCVVHVDIGSTFMLDSSLAGANVLMIRCTKNGYSKLFDEVFSEKNISKSQLADFRKLWINYNGDIDELTNILARELSIADSVRTWFRAW